MQDNSYIQQIKNQELYSISNNSEVDSMLSYSDANKILNNSLAKYTHILNVISSNWKGSYKYLFNSDIYSFETRMMTIDGRTRLEAIKIKGEGLRELEKKKGFMGLFSKGDQ